MSLKQNGWHKAGSFCLHVYFLKGEAFPISRLYMLLPHPEYPMCDKFRPHYHHKMISLTLLLFFALVSCLQCDRKFAKSFANVIKLKKLILQSSLKGCESQVISTIMDEEIEDLRGGMVCIRTHS